MTLGDELQTFRTYAAAMPNRCLFLVDTYDTLEGVRRAVQVRMKLRQQGYALNGVRLDSGDLAELSIAARRILDEHGFHETPIVASNKLDEYKINRLKKQGAAITMWGWVLDWLPPTINLLSEVCISYLSYDPQMADGSIESSDRTKPSRRPTLESYRCEDSDKANNTWATFFMTKQPAFLPNPTTSPWKLDASAGLSKMFNGKISWFPYSKKATLFTIHRRSWKSNHAPPKTRLFGQHNYGDHEQVTVSCWCGKAIA